MNQITFRAAVAGDVPEIASIWHQGWHQGHADVVPKSLVASRIIGEFLVRTADHLHQTQVAEIDGKIAGFFMLDEREIYQFYVAHGFQGQGVATALMRQAEVALGQGTAWLACSVGNERAAAFYRKLRWDIVQTTPYEVETSGGSQTVNVWRFEKAL